ncbi:MAG: NADH-quinone oxidoreductase subunit NuoE [Armatimonadota bacterium]
MTCTCCEDKFDEITEYIKGVFNPEHPQSALIAILHHAQGMYGYLSKEVMEHIAQVTEVPAAEIYGVATFYSFFKHTQQGKHQIHVCMGTACYIRGGAKILETVEDMLDIKPGETTHDMLFTLGETRCIGACGLAPVMVIDDKVYGRVEPEQLKGILAEYRERAES